MENLERCRKDNFILTQEHQELLANYQSSVQQVNDLKCQIVQFEHEASSQKMKKMEAKPEIEEPGKEQEQPKTNNPPKQVCWSYSQSFYKGDPLIKGSWCVHNNHDINSFSQHIWSEWGF